ncbi:MAG: TnsA endonuclease N-terminal domain-containing protein [Cyclobacteriaceae bacterium]
MKTKSTHRCESTLEFEFMYLVEFDPLVRSFEAQPISLPYTNEKGRKTRYTPDLKIVYTNKGAQQLGYAFSLVEIKYKGELDQFKEDFAPAFNAAQVYCDTEGGIFEIVHEDIIKTPKLASYKFLHRYLDAASVPKMDFDLMKLASELGTFTPNDWVSKISGTGRTRNQALANLWHLVATRTLEIDFDSQITMKSTIKLPTS